MPTYTYRCKACAHEFDQFQKFSDDPLTVCPECGAEIRRVIQPVGVVFKGSGWYITDNRKTSDTSSDGGQKHADKAAEKTTGKADDTTKAKETNGKADDGGAKTPSKAEPSKTPSSS